MSVVVGFLARILMLLSIVLLVTGSWEAMDKSDLYWVIIFLSASLFYGSLAVRSFFEKEYEIFTIFGSFVLLCIFEFFYLIRYITKTKQKKVIV